MSFESVINKRLFLKKLNKFIQVKRHKKLFFKKIDTIMKLSAIKTSIN